MAAGTLRNLPFKINVCAEREFDRHQEMSDVMPVKLDHMQSLLKNVCTGKVAGPVGTGQWLQQIFNMWNSCKWT